MNEVVKTQDGERSGATSGLAVALRYDGEGAPRVTAKGRGHVAEQILALAREHNVPIQQQPDLVRLLSKVDLGEEIPEALYVAVAEVIAFAFLVSGREPPRPRE